MSTAEMKARVHQMVDSLDDAFLNVVHSMLDTYVEQNVESIKTIDGQVLTIESYKSEIREAEKQIDQGDFMSHEEVGKALREW